ncbi:MAG: hypothetical protein IKM20_01730 [Erysipelotrichales bacterium]|nr:hypothetical protein [Erysipelotrichales bacterium]
MSDSKNKSIVTELQSNAYSRIHNTPTQLDTTNTSSKKERKHFTIFITIIVILILLFIFF